MTEWKDCTLINEQVQLDDAEFDKCVLTGCSLIYNGGVLPKMTNCTLNGCTFKLEGPAWSTVSWLSSLYSGLPGGREFSEELFERIRIGA